MRAVLKAKAERGERLGTRAPYGYKKDENDSKKLVVDEEAAAIVRRIFAMCAAGSGPSQIARKLREEQILCPTTYAYQKFGIGHISLNTEKPYHWSDSTIANMLENELYLGNTINMRFSTKSYKDKRHVEHPKEECLVFEGTHPHWSHRKSGTSFSGCGRTGADPPRCRSRTNTQGWWCVRTAGPPWCCTGRIQ